MSDVTVNDQWDDGLSDTLPDDEPEVLDALLDEIGKEVRRDSISLIVPMRPKITLQFDPNIISNERLQEWRNKAGEKSKKGLNGLVLSSLILVWTSSAVLFNGVQAFDHKGKPITLRSPEILERTGKNRAIDAVRTLFSCDPHLDDAAMKVLEAAGYGEESERDDGMGNPMRA